MGTGFFFRFTVDTWAIPSIVTNRHVIEDMRRFELRFTKETDDGRPDVGNIATFDDQDFNASWIPHPDSAVDLCVLPIANLLGAAADQGIKLWVTYVDSSFIPGPEDMARLTALEEVVMVGYPLGLFDSTNNMPIFRKGVAATHPRDDYEGRKRVLGGYCVL